MTDDAPACIHHLTECDHCGGLQVTRLDALPGITGIAITDGDGNTRRYGVTMVYIGPADTPCK